MSKCKVKSDDVERAFRIAKSIIKSNSHALPILDRAVVFKEKSGSLCIGATNLEQSCIVELYNVNFSGKGSMASCPDIKTVLDVIKEICTTDLRISVDQTGTKTSIVTDDNDKFEVMGDEAKEFPVVAMPGCTKYFSPVKEKSNENEHYIFSMEVNKEVLDEVIKRVLPACAVNTLRPILSGVLVDINDGRLKFVSTDSYRLSEMSFSEEEGYKVEYGQFKEMIIPGATFSLLADILKQAGADDNVKIYWQTEVEVYRYSKDDNLEGKDVKPGDIQGERAVRTMFCIQLNDSTRVLLSSRVIEGKYPDYEQIVPKKSKKYPNRVEFSIDRNILHRVVKSSHVFAKDCNNNMLMEFSPKGEYMEVITPETTRGKFSKKVKDINCIKMNENKIALSTQYLMDAIRMLDGADMRFNIFSSECPALLSMDEREFGKFMHLIMPLRIQE